MDGYQYIAKTFKKYGVTHIFYVESMLENTILEAKKLGIKAVLTHTENAAGYMADGYGRASGKPGICMAQSIGVANLAGGIFDGNLANSPIIAITGKKPPVMQYTGAYQEGEHRLLYEGITKLNAEIIEGKQLPHILRQLFHTTVTGKPGPVHADLYNNLGVDIEFATVDDAIDMSSVYNQAPLYRPAADSQEVSKTAVMINEAHKPLLIVGRGAILSNASEALVSLAKKADIPVVTTPDGKTIIDETDLLFAGIIGAYGNACANITAEKTDLAIFVGTQASDQSTINWTMPPKNVQTIQIDIEPKELGRNYPNTLGLYGDADTVLKQLIELVDLKKREAWISEVKKYMQNENEDLDKEYPSDSSTISPYRLCEELTKVLPDDAVLVADTGNSAIWTATSVKMRPTQKYYRAAGSLGWSLPGSMGIKCALPDRPVICFLGDGAMYYHLSELETAVRYGINTVTIINNNNGFVQVKELLDIVYKEETVEEKEKAFRFSGINFSRIAEEMGCWSIRVENKEDIGTAIAKALSAGKPAVIEVLSDDSYTPNPLVGKTRPLYGAALARPK